mgnify:CR=1 FL=1|jgi:diguanylate cyclase
MSWNIAAECISIVFLSIILVYAYKGTLLPSWKNRMFQCCLGATFAAMVSNVLSTLLLASPHWVDSWLCWGVTEIYFLATPLMGLAYYCYTAATVFEEHAGGRRALWLGILPGVLYAVLVLLNPWTGMLFTIRAGVYLRGPWIITTYLIFYFYDTEKSTFCGFREDLSRLSRRSQRNKKPPAMRVGKKSYTVESPFRIK